MRMKIWTQNSNLRALPNDMSASTLWYRYLAVVGWSAQETHRHMDVSDTTSWQAR